MFNKEECLRFIEEENVKFIRLAFLMRLEIKKTLQFNQMHYLKLLKKVFHLIVLI